MVAWSSEWWWVVDHALFTKHFSIRINRNVWAPCQIVFFSIVLGSIWNKWVVFSDKALLLHWSGHVPFRLREKCAIRCWFSKFTQTNYRVGLDEGLRNLWLGTGPTHRVSIDINIALSKNWGTSSRLSILLRNNEFQSKNFPNWIFKISQKVLIPFQVRSESLAVWNLPFNLETILVWLN